MTKDDFLTRVWTLLQVPLQIILIGLAAVMVVLAAQRLGLNASLTELVGGTGGIILVGLLVFLIGVLAFLFLWWLAREAYKLIANPQIDDTRLQSMKDLPLGLPEGTVRAMLALIVGMVGLPLLLFSDVLHINAATSGYVSTIIAGVFSFYFGSRSSAGDAQTARNLSSAVGSLQSANNQLQSNNADLTTQRDQLQGQNQGLTQTATVSRKTQLSSQLDTLGNYTGLLETLVTTLGPALPKGLVPAGLDTLLAQGKSALTTASQLADGDITDNTIGGISKLVSNIAGASPLGGLLKSAAGIFGPLTEGAGPLGAVAIVLTVGWNLSASAYKRWCARVLDAPYEPGLIDIGTVSAASAALRMASCPIFSQVFAKVKDTQPGFYGTLVNTVLSDNAATELLKQYGPQGLFTGLSQVQQGVAEFRRVLLDDASAGDITDTQVKSAAATLAQGAADIQVGTPNVADINRVINELAARPATDEQKAALDALVLLTTKMHDQKIDVGAAIADLSKTGATT
jgi:hypothetical protein